MKRLPRIGVISTYFSGAYLGEFFTELLRLAGSRGFRVIVITPGLLQGYSYRLSIDLCDAWIIPMEAVGLDLVKFLSASGKPICSVGHRLPVDGIGSTRSDNPAGTRLAIQALYAEGHRKFAFIGNLDSSDIRERHEAFLSFLAEKDLPREAARVVHTASYSRAGGQTAIAELEKRAVEYTALVAGNDQNAVGALNALRVRGVSVPHQVAVFGYDNSALAAEPEHQLSSVDQNIAGLAQQAVEQILKRLSNPSAPVEHGRTLPQLVLRRSSTSVTPARTLSYTSFTVEEAELAKMYSNELSRFLYEGEDQVELLLAVLGQNGRRAQWGQYHDGRFDAVIPEDHHEATERFGEALLEATEADNDFLTIAPKEQAGALSNALAVTIPLRHLLSPALLAMASREIELTAYSIDRATAQERLERLVVQRTEELRSLQAEVVRTAQVAVLIPIVTGIAHHLNTPLGNCITAVSALLEQAQASVPPERLVPGLELVGRGLERAAKLIQEFQQVTNLQTDAGNTDFDVLPLIANGISQQQARFRDLVVLVSIPSQRLLITGQPSAFAAALEALLENGAVHGHQKGQPARLRVEAFTEVAQLVLVVEDEGPGLGKLRPDQVLAPFFTTRMADSSGLGLTLVNRVVTQQFQGSLRLGSSSAGGLRVEARFPLAGGPSLV